MHKIIKTLISIVVTLIVLLILAYGVSKSDFTKIKKYDSEDSVRSSISQAPPSSVKRAIAKERFYTTKVKIKDGSMASLGDFTLNISGDRKLTANISLKFKENKGNSWMSGKSVEQEILNKGDVLRSAVINIISNDESATVSNKRMKEELVKSMNKYLSNGEIEEVYFNKFIIQ